MPVEKYLDHHPRGAECELQQLDELAFLLALKVL
jgi:hypothetical protein